MDITRRRNLTAAIPSPLLRNSNNFEDFGCFDEEECRFFLREVGERVVPVYPFSFGMEEVYSLILERYGYSGLPDATSVLQDLLESDGTAGGLGDDGDVWRSWRHSWRHRNDDALNPFIPKVGTFILQPPTLPHVRKIKALNFIRMSEESEREEQAREAVIAGKRKAFCEVTPERGRVMLAPTTTTVQQQHSEEGDLYRLPSTTYSHQRTRTLLSSSRGSPTSRQEQCQRPSTARESDKVHQSFGGSSQPELPEVDPLLFDANIDPSLLITFGMLSPSRPSGEAGLSPTLRGGHGEAVTFQPINSQGSPSSKIPGTVLSNSPLPRIQSSPFRVFTPETPRSHVRTDASIRSSRVVSEPLQVSVKEDKQGSVEHDKSFERLRKLSDGLRPFVRRPAGDNSERSKRIRATHRQVRILDGVILNPKVRKRLSSPPITAVEDEMPVEDKKKSGVRRSLTPVWQKRDSSRHSWMEIMRNFFRTEATACQTAKQSKRESSNLSQPAVRASTTPPSHHTNDNSQTTQRDQPSYLLGLDGTVDPRPFFFRTIAFRMSRMSRMDCNKPLPLSPPGIARSLSAHPGFPNAFQPRPSDPAILTRANTRADLKRNLQALTAHALKRKEIPDKHQFCPVYDELGDTFGDQTVDPAKPVQQPLSALTYSSVTNANPFVNQQNVPASPRQSQPPLSGITYSSIQNANPFFGAPDTPSSGFCPIPTSRQGNLDFSLPPPASKPHFSTISPQASTLNPAANVFTPFKNLMRKGSSSKGVNDNATTGGSPSKHHTRKISLGKLSNLLKNPFMSQVPTEEKIDQWMAGTNVPSIRPAAASPARPPVVSLDPAFQAYVLGQVEGILVKSTNGFLLHSGKMGRLDRGLVEQVAADWKEAGRAPVIDFFYDCQTQRQLVLRHAATVKFNNLDNDRFARALELWSALVAALSPRVLCLTDKVILGHVYALPEVLRMLRAPEATRVAARDLGRRVTAEVDSRKAAVANTAGI
ncbi:hypothetical protein CLCR_05412 [Cladophialophora carrionii]|uniref:Uncharacterized protein n=1 Tax=Cladophialophora carrionii TaxID=86049 RepID=A0A1C1C9V7_9EURO|nr:hypothetical protein CLCR_05412 [Cladophialophora carrionii]